MTKSTQNETVLSSSLLLHYLNLILMLSSGKVLLTLIQKQSTCSLPCVKAACLQSSASAWGTSGFSELQGCVVPS